MAKDPATLWYWNDWQGGTVTLTRHLKGCYIDLLHAQFNNGRMSLAQIKTVLGVDYANAWPTLQAKFKKDDNDNFYNVRAEEEVQKRKGFVDSRKHNGSKGGRPKTKPLGYPKNNLTEDVNEDRNEVAIVFKGGTGEKEPVNGVFTDLIDKLIELTEMQIGTTIEFIRLTSKKTLTDQEVRDYWDAFKINQFYKHEWYSSFEDVVSHFRNSLKKQLNGTYQQTSGDPKKGTSEARTEALKRW
jgi:uncharacterized protein YdaU (DUF1376 family)